MSLMNHCVKSFISMNASTPCPFGSELLPNLTTFRLGGPALIKSCGLAIFSLCKPSDHDPEKFARLESTPRTSARDLSYRDSAASAEAFAEAEFESVQAAATAGPSYRLTSRRDSLQPKSQRRSSRRLVYPELVRYLERIETSVHSSPRLLPYQTERFRLATENASPTG